jgi:uncharacterized protein involved in exopolysaccharide biosynthesis
MDQPREIQVNEDEISLKDLIKIAHNWFSLLRKNIKLVSLIGFLGALAGFYLAFSKKPTYKAELRFVVKSEGSASGLSGMLGGLGSVLGGSSTGSPLERTIEIASSDRIVGSALLSEVQIAGKRQVLANSLIRLNRLDKSWAKDTVLRNVQFSVTDTSIELMSFPKRKAIKTLEALLIPKTGDGIISKSFDKKSGVVTLAATHSNEEFSIILAKEVFNKLRDFYVEQMTNSAANNVLILQKKVDSIKFELAKVQSFYARTTDQSFGLLFQEDKVELKKLAVREQMLLAMYAEVQKNLETFKFMNDSAIPSLTVIDMPYSPLKKIQRSKILFALGGFFLGGLLTFLFIAIRRWYKNLMTS